MTQLNIIVTGGFGELGTAVAKAFALQGHNVCRADFAPQPSPCNHKTLDVAGIDLSNTDDCQQLVSTVKDAFGGIDALINIAGGFSWGTLDSDDTQSWQRMYTMNLLTAVTVSKAALAEIKRSETGRIVNIGAIAALSADAGMGAYTASKAGIHRFTEALANELLGSTVTVNAILPSTIDTQANRASMPDADTSNWVKPDAIADVILFLTSAAARSISGALIPISKSC
jgi:NAD(P)-dependent dehydrogenase (short-subunit alcohol dehydrogenase family)